MRSMYTKQYMEFIGSCVFITSNGLPALSKDQDNEYDWDAICVRTSFVKTEVSHQDKGKHAFPYNATEIAHYLMHLTTKFDEGEPVLPLKLGQSVSVLGKRCNSQRTDVAGIDKPTKMAKTSLEIKWGQQALLDKFI